MDSPEQGVVADPGERAASSAARTGLAVAPNQTPPNQITLQGNGISIEYGWWGSPAVMWYRDPNRSLTYNEATLTDVPVLGTVVNVTIVPSGADISKTTFSFVVPPVEIPGPGFRSE